jgi:hypothetical protein
MSTKRAEWLRLLYTPLELYHKDDDGFLNTIRVTGDETWVLFVNVET